MFIYLCFYFKDVQGRVAIYKHTSCIQHWAIKIIHRFKFVIWLCCRDITLLLSTFLRCNRLSLCCAPPSCCWSRSLHSLHGCCATAWNLQSDDSSSHRAQDVWNDACWGGMTTNLNEIVKSSKVRGVTPKNSCRLIQEMLSMKGCHKVKTLHLRIHF